MTIRRRIGLLLPSTNSVMEPDFYRLAPPEVTVHTARMWMWKGSPGSEEEGDHYRRMNQDIDDASRNVASANVELMVYACTGGSFLEGPGGEREVMDRIENVTQVPAISTSYAILEGLRELGLRRLSIATPYSDAINQRLKLFLEGNGFQVVSIAGNEVPRTGDNKAGGPNDQDPQTIRDFVLDMVSPEADGVFCSCVGWRAVEVTEELEQRLGKPVVTSNQATIWLALKRLGITTPIKGHGRLLASLAPMAA